MWFKRLVTTLLFLLIAIPLSSKAFAANSVEVEIAAFEAPSSSSSTQSIAPACETYPTETTIATEPTEIITEPTIFETTATTPVADPIVIETEPEETEPVECVSNSAINTRVNTQTGLFIENTYEIDMLKHKLESGEKSIDKIPYEKKLELIRSYEKENEMLETEIRMILRTNNNN